MPTMQRMAQALGFYIHLKNVSGVTKDVCLAAADYHEFLADVVSQATASALVAGFTAQNPLTALEDITLSQVQYEDIVEQIYTGVSFMVVSLQIPPLAPVAVPANTNYFADYLASLGGDTRTENDVGEILGRVNEILGTRELDRQRVNGLVVGRVQSGKTRNYVGLMLKAVEEGWNVLIVLTSANKALADQTQTRIARDFQRSQAWMGQMLDFRNNVNIPSPNALQAAGSGMFFWGVAMKQKQNLERIQNWLQANKVLNRYMRVMVIDDEADNATPDGNAANSKLMTEGQIDDLVAAIRDEDPNEWDYSDLADWVENLPSHVEGLMHEQQNDPGSKIDCAIREVRSFLDGPGAIPNKRNVLLNDAQFLKLMDLLVHPAPEDGHSLNVAQDAKFYFNKPKGSGPRAMGTFIKLLKTVFEVAEERTTISALICKLIDRPMDSRSYTFDFDRCAYIAYTATPYACILNERPDETPLYADFIYSLELSPRYFGLDKIFGRDLNSPSANMTIVDPNPDEDVRFVLRPIQQIKDREIDPPAVLNVSPLDSDLGYTCTNPNYSGNWDSMKRALAWAFCTAGARRWFRREKYVPRINDNPNLDVAAKAKKLQELDYRWTTMLVNISQKQSSHEKQKDAICGYLLARCSAPADQAAFLNQCELTWEDLKGAFTKATFDQLFNSVGGGDDYGEIADYPAWSDIENDIRFFIENFHANVHTIVINSENAENRDRQDFYNQVGAHAGELAGDHLWIVCGGNTISRGLTLTGLTVSYFDRIRRGVAVDTLTQMGRWFGYRGDYELLPRLWMTEETVAELKRTAIVEYRMHESIRENFDAHFSPADPDHYQQIYCWGRRLSGRTRAQRQLTTAVGTNSSTDDLSLKATAMNGIYNAALAFIGSLGGQAVRPASDFRLYNQFPLWVNVDKNKIKNYFEALVQFSTERSKLVLRALIREIDLATADDPEDLNWDVVIGEPGPTHITGSFPLGAHRDIGSGTQAQAPIKHDAIRFTSARSYQAYYAMIETNVLNIVDERIVRDGIDDVVAEIEHKTALHNGAMPAAFATALAPFPAADLKHRVLALLDWVHADFTREVPPCLRDCISEAVRNRVSGEYRELVHGYAEHNRPTLQFFLMTPPAEAETSAVPLIVHSVYWPSHVPDGFHAVAAGLPPREVIHPTDEDFGNAVVAVLTANGFPMTPGNGLRDQVVAHLEHCDEEFFNQNIADNPSKAPYVKIPGTNAYCLSAWADDPLAKLREFVLDRAMEIFADHAPHEERDVATQIVAENQKLAGVLTLVRQSPSGSVSVADDWQAIFTPAVIAAKGLEIVSARPKTYRLP